MLTAVSMEEAAGRAVLTWMDLDSSPRAATQLPVFLLLNLSFLLCKVVVIVPVPQG